MTRKRQKWWDSLPEREKILRKDLSYLKYQRSKEKERISIEQNGTSKKIILERINCYTVFIRTLKHELDRTTTMIYTGHYQGVLPIYRCEKCGNEIEDIGQWCCPWCGREIKERKE